MNDIKKIIEMVGKDKGIDKELIIEALEAAMLSVAKKKFGHEKDIEAIYNEEESEIELFQFRTVVDTVENESLEISIEDAKVSDPDAAVEDSLGEKLEIQKFTRVAAQEAKQIIIQKMRSAEKDVIYEEFKDRKGELISGIVRRRERQDVIVDLGRTEAVLPFREQVPNEFYRIKDRIQCYVVDVKRITRGQQIILSRAHQGLLVRLFELEVSEISEGIVEIKNGVRDPGFRSKIAVYSRESSIDPVGACVGIKGSRVQNIVQELGGEKIDIVPWDMDEARFMCNALSPAEVSKVIVNENTHGMEVIVPDDQLSLAIGKRGQNVRLAAKLTGWKIDIKSESKMEETKAIAREILMQISSLSTILATVLVNEGFRSVEEISKLNLHVLLNILPVAEELAQSIIDEARVLLKDAGFMDEDVPLDVLGRELTVDDRLLLGLPEMSLDKIKKLNTVGYYSVDHLSRASADVLAGKIDLPETEIQALIDSSSSLGESPEQTS